MKIAETHLHFILLCILLLFVFFIFGSCTKADIAITASDIRPFVTKANRMGVSFWVHPEGYDEITAVELKSPDEEFTWHLNVTSTVYNKVKYMGSSDAVMPIGTDLMQGKWSYVLVFKDGRNYEGFFSITYRDKEGALQRAENNSLPYYDSKANLTVISE